MDRLGLLVTGVLVTVLFVPPAWHILSRGVPDLAFASDRAIIELFTLHAARSVQLLGPYSRFGWHHPGPAFFYLLLPIYEAFGEHSGALFLGVLLLALGSALGIVAVAVWLGGRGAAMWTALMLALWASSLGTGRIVDIWNPHATLLPFALFLFLCAGWVLGHVRLSPAIAAVGSFLVQTHLGYLPPVAVAFLSSEALRRVWGRLGAPTPPRPGGPWWVAATLVLLVMWLPPIVEQFAEPRGNLHRIVRSLLDHNEGHRLGEVAPLLSMELSRVPRAAAMLLLGFSPRASTSAAPSVLTWLEGILLASALVLAVRRGNRFAAALCVLGGGGAAAAHWSATQIKGPVYDYLLLWVSAFGFVAWCGIGAILVPHVGSRLGRRARTLVTVIGASAAVVLIALAASSISREPPLPAGDDDTVRRLADDLRTFLGRDAAMAPVVRIEARDRWPIAAGIVLRLYKASVPVFVEPRWLFMFGPQFAPDEADRPCVLIGDQLLAEGAPARPGRVLVTRHDGIDIYFTDEPKCGRRSRSTTSTSER